MIVVAFSMIDKAKIVKFFEKPCLIADIGLKMVFKKFYFILTNININCLI